MENLFKYTTRLLAYNNCVPVPGFGAFFAHNVSAVYNAKDGIFMPPHRVLRFHPNININDDLLLSEYMDDQKLSYDDAAKRLHNDVASLRRALSAKGEVRAAELGAFSMNIKGEISFTPDANGIDDPSNFGLEPLMMPLLADCEKKDIVIKRHTFRRIVSVAAVAAVVFFLLAPVAESLYTPSMQAGIPVKRTAPAVEQTVPEAVEKQVAAVEPLCEIAPVKESVTEAIITEEYALEQAAKENSIAEIAEAGPVNSEVAVEEANTPQFSIIVASSPNEKNAELAIKEMNSKMQAGYTVVKGGGRYRIAHSTYSSNADAMSALSQIKGTFPDAWILTH